MPTAETETGIETGIERETETELVNIRRCC
jgi:hypothetical protein